MLQLISALISTYLPAEKEEGQGLVEYGLIIVFVAIAAIVGLTALGGGLNTMFEAIKGKLAVT